MCCPFTPGLRELEPEDPSLAPNFPPTLLGKPYLSCWANRALVILVGDKELACWRVRASRTQSGWTRPVIVRLLPERRVQGGFPCEGLGWLWNCMGDWIEGAVAVRIRSQLREKGDEVMETGNFTAGTETPLEPFKIRPQSSRKFGSEDIPYRIGCDGL